MFLYGKRFFFLQAAKIICGHENFKRFYELVEIDLTLYHFGENEQTNRTYVPVPILTLIMIIFTYQIGLWMLCRV